MEIKKITLCNFGSYEGVNRFDTEISGKKSIVLFGGKNGAGKTTLFTAIRVCLYGYKSMGYKNKSAYYFKSIIKLINNNAKLKRPTDAAVSLTLKIKNGTAIDEYIVTRSWFLEDSLSENFYVKKNGTSLDEDAVADFEKYILNIIPPELFNLYFFDGERIADFFLNEEGTKHFKEAFLTLCGYDVFDIMQNNFKRVASSTASSSFDIRLYISAKEEYQSVTSQIEELQQKLADSIDSIKSYELEIEELERNYKTKGGISKDKWASLLKNLNEEEIVREKMNSSLKKWANDIVPFVILKDELLNLSRQLDQEGVARKYTDFLEVLDEVDIKRILKTNESIVNELEKYASKRINESGNIVLGLSSAESSILHSTINSILSFDITEITDTKKQIKESVLRSAKIRERLENSSIAAVEQFIERRDELHNCINLEMQRQSEIDIAIAETSVRREIAETNLNKIKQEFERHLKTESIGDISAKAIIMLDNLRNVLYVKQIEKVEKHFLNIINVLMYKINFIDDIKIDESFGIHIYRNKLFSGSELYRMASDLSVEEFRNYVGEKAVKLLSELPYGSSLLDKIKNAPESIVIPVEIDKSSLSNGEKQIFIMALYFALIQLSNQEVPFIIDTPFARIDKEHRNNISKHFFNKLKGQIFILSTDEEIDSEHVQIIQKNVASTYLLENKDNKKTVISGGKYFEE